MYGLGGINRRQFFRPIEILEYAGSHTLEYKGVYDVKKIRALYRDALRPRVLLFYGLTALLYVLLVVGKRRVDFYLLVRIFQRILILAEFIKNLDQTERGVELPVEFV
jgi:hypothetical protein